MTEEREEFDELLDRTLQGRVNAVAPVGMAGRIQDAAAREPVVVAMRVPFWRLAIAASVVLAVAGSVYGVYRGRREHTVVAVREAPAPVPVGAETAVVAAEPVSRVSAAYERRPVRVGGAVGLRTARLPKLDVFPYSALHEEPVPAGSVQAQVRLLASLPQSTLAMLAKAETQEREQDAKRAASQADAE